MATLGFVLGNETQSKKLPRCQSSMFYQAVESSLWCVPTLAAIKACKHSDRENERVNASVFTFRTPFECFLAAIGSAPY